MKVYLHSSSATQNSLQFDEFFKNRIQNLLVHPVVKVEQKSYLGLLVNDFLIGLLAVDLRCGSLVGGGSNVHGSFRLVNTHVEKFLQDEKVEMFHS